MHGKFLSAQPDGSAQWNRDVASAWEYFHVEERPNGKITLRGAHGKYVSAQADGSVQINRDAAPPGGWEEFTAELRENSVVCLKSCHGKYLSAQQNGTAQWNRDHAPRGGWEDIQIVSQGSPSQVSDAAARIQKHIKTGRSSTPTSSEGIVAGNTTITTSKSTYTIDEGIDFSFTASKLPDDAWIGIVPAAIPHGDEAVNDSHDTSYEHLRGRTNGDITLPNPGLGTWTLRLHDTDNNGRELTHVAFEVVSSRHQEPIEILEAVTGEPVRFKLNHPPNHHQAWVGIYPTGASDQDHGAHNQRWKYIRDIDVNNVSIPNQGEGNWSIRVFSDGGYTLVERKEFTIHSAHGTRPTDATTRIQNQTPVKQQEPIEILEAVTGRPVRFKINNPPTNHDAWVGIYPPNASDQDHGAENNRWKWLRNIDVNNASFPKRSAGPWSIRVFSNGGHALHERKDFDVKPPQSVDSAVLESSRRSALIALFIGMVLLAPSIPLFIAGLGEGLSDGMTSATLDIEDGDGQGDLGWGIYVEGSAVDFNSNGIFDHCENIIVNATHSGSWMSDPWSGYQKVNAPDETRQVFYLETAHEGSGCNSNDWSGVESRHHDGRDLIKIGRACHGCMAGTTTITAQNTDGGEVVMWIQNEEKKEVLGMLIPGAIFMGIGGFIFVLALGTLLNMGFKSNAPSSSKIRAGVGITLFGMGLPLVIIGSISTGEGRLAMFVPGAVMVGIGAFMTVATAIRMGSTEGPMSVARTGAAGSASTNLEVLSFNHRQPVRFSITNPLGHNDAWVGLYPANAGDRDHGDRWHYLRDIDVSNATLPGQEQGQWSLRLFSDGGYNVQQRVDFELRAESNEEVWMKEAELEDLRLKGMVPDHRNNFTKKITTSKILAQHKVGNLTRFETADITYLVYDHDLQEGSASQNPFWEAN